MRIKLKSIFDMNDETVLSRHLRLFSFCGVNDGGATHFGHFVFVAVEGPTADLLTPNHVFNEQNPVVEDASYL